jgi:hypothetical protein
LAGGSNLDWHPHANTHHRISPEGVSENKRGEGNQPSASTIKLRSITWCPATIRTENKIIRPEFPVFPIEGEVHCRKRLGGLLRHYYREAA